MKQGVAREFKLIKSQIEAVKVLSNENYRTVLLYGGARSSKTFLLVYLSILRASKAAGSEHLIIRRSFNALKRSVIEQTYPKVLSLCFENLKAYINFNKTDAIARLPNGSTIWFGGLDDTSRIEKILGCEFSTIFLNEASECGYKAYSILVTRLAQKSDLKHKFYIDENPPSRAHWTYKLFFEGTHPDGKPLENKGEFAAFKMNPADNLKNLPDDFLKSLESLPEAEKNRFLRGNFADIGGVEGGVYNAELEAAQGDGRICDLAPISDRPLHAVFDIGVTDATAIWICQFVDDKIHLLEYLEDKFKALPYYLSLIKEKGYKINTLYLPWDANNRSWGTGRTVRETAISYGRLEGFNVEITPRLSMQDGLHAGRLIFESCYFNSNLCRKGLDALGGYRYDFSDNANDWKGQPLHDWASHGADAFRYLAIVYRKLKQDAKNEKIRDPYKIYADELFIQYKDYNDIGD
jgi:phage terminase large subunit